MLSTLEDGSSTASVPGGSTKKIHMEKLLRVQWLSAAELEPLKLRWWTETSNQLNFVPCACPSWLGSTLPSRC